MASLVDYEDSDGDPDLDCRTEPQPHLELQHDEPFIVSSSSSSTSSSVPVFQSSSSSSSSSVPALLSSFSSSSSSSSSSVPAPLSSSSSSSVPTLLSSFSSSSSSSVPVALISSSSSSSSALSSSGSCSSVKRVAPHASAVRPYVPKRLRLSTAEPAPVQAAPLDSSGSPLLSEVSERVRPFLGRRPVRAELPRRVQCGIEAHQGPVNCLQWNPELRLSHLLLSASMDHTCKVWDGAGSGRCLQTYSAHRGAVRDACWLACGRRLLSGSFDGTVAVTDLETGQTVTRMDSGFKVCCVAPRPHEPDLFLCGGFSSEVKAWDARCRKVLRAYRAAVQQTLDLLFLSAGREFVSSTDAVSRDSAERTLIAWDFQTGAKLSNQIFHERYTCPCLTAHPLENSFIAQTNGNYIALFSGQRPYRMNKSHRYEGHKVEGFAVHCGFSADGSVVVSGSSTGSVHFYDFQSSRTLKTLRAHEHACVCATLHPVIPGLTATCGWTGQIRIWT